MHHCTPGRSPPRYFLALFPCGYYWINVVRDDVPRRYAYLAAGEYEPGFVCGAERLPLDALVVCETREITAREAREVRAMCSALVPTQAYLAKLIEQRLALLRVIPLYREAGEFERAEMLTRRIDRLTRRGDRLMQSQLRGWLSLRGMTTRTPVIADTSYFQIADTNLLASYHPRPFPQVVGHA